MHPFLDQLRQRNEPLFVFGAICLLGALLCLSLTRLTQTQVMGINAWYKPAKFLLSTAIFVWSMAWYTHHLGDS